MATSAVKEAVGETIHLCLRNGDPGPLDESTPLLGDDSGLDSLALVELLMGLGEAFRIEFDEDDLTRENFATVGDVVRLVARKQAAL